MILMLGTKLKSLKLYPARLLRFSILNDLIYTASQTCKILDGLKHDGDDIGLYYLCPIERYEYRSSDGSG